MFEVKARPPVGFSLVEFLIVLSVAVILLSGVDSWLVNFKARSRVSEALAVAETAKTEIIITCAAEPAVGELTRGKIRHEFPDSLYVETITVTGSCDFPQIMLTTRNTGLNVDPRLIIFGEFAGSSVSWTCRSSGLEVDTPKRCRSG